MIKEKNKPNTAEDENITMTFNVPIILKDSIKKNNDKPKPPTARIKR